MSRQSASFGQLLRYVNAPERKGCGALLHNLLADGDALLEIEREFLENSRYCASRKGGILLYHEVLSLSGADREHIDEAMLEDLASRYLEWRAPQALAYGKVHFDREHPHVHLVISANGLKSAKKLRLSKQRFDEIKRALEHYQREKYPELVNSLALAGSRRELMRKDGVAVYRQERKEAERGRRLANVAENGREAALSEREGVFRRMADGLATARSEAGFEALLAAAGMQWYVRGKTAGVMMLESGKKYRLRTLGLADAYQQQVAQWQRVRRRGEELARVAEERSREQWAELGFHEGILVALASSPENERAGEVGRC